MTQTSHALSPGYRNSVPGVVAEIPLEHPRRLEVESVIRHRFWLEHGAHVSEFLPNLLALDGPQGRILGTAG